MATIIENLLASPEACIRHKALGGALGESPDAPEAQAARAAIPSSETVRRLLSPGRPDGTFPGSPYAKYWGAHWVLILLADLGYPPGDESLFPLRDQVYGLWLHPEHVRERVVDREAARCKSWAGVPIIEGRARRCASQEGNALYATLALGIADERADRLAGNLVRWQWPDGGWNCDRKTGAVNSSFFETLAPLRGLALHARLTGSRESRQAAERAAEVFLRRGLFRRLRDGQVMNEDFLKLHTPCYWLYDILYALRVMAEAGFLGDPRCGEALDVLDSKRLPDGGFPRERRVCGLAQEPRHGATLVDWGAISRRRSNPFVTVDALHVLRLAGRWSGALTMAPAATKRGGRVSVQKSSGRSPTEPAVGGAVRTPATAHLLSARSLPRPTRME